MSFRGCISDNSDFPDSDSDFEPLTQIQNPSSYKFNNSNFTLNPPILTIKMSTPTLPILKPEYLNMIPEFRGERELLPRFIEISEKIVNRFYNAMDPNDFQNEYLMSSILAKVKGDAAVNISSNIITNWADLKKCLINTYADKRDCYTLNIELTELRQNNSETPFEFYDRVQHLLNLQISYLSTHIEPSDAVTLIGYFRNYALRILLRGLKEPIGSLMRTKNPCDLNTALSMLTNDFQLDINARKDEKNKISHNIKGNIPNKINRNFNPTNFNSYNARFTPNQSKPISNTNNTNFYARQAGPSTSTNVPRQNTNVFRQNSNHTFQKTVPMTTSTRNTYRPQFQNSNFRPNRQNFIAEELFNIEQQPSSQDTENDFLEEVASGNISN